jgi:hypothetical protein
LPVPGGKRTVIDTGRRRIRRKQEGARSVGAPISPRSGIRGTAAIAISQNPDTPQP